MTWPARWEEPYGWTRTGFGSTADKEEPLARVAANLLPVPDAWYGFAEHYLDALDHAGPGPRARFAGARSRARDRADRLAAWHVMLIERLIGSDHEQLLDRLVTHPALDGPEHVFTHAQLSRARGKDDEARRLVRTCLKSLPGHRGFPAFAWEVGA